MNCRRLRGRFYRKAGGGRMFGHRCKDYCAGCIVCDGYRFLDETGRFPRSFDEAFVFSRQCVMEEESSPSREKEEA